MKALFLSLVLLFGGGAQATTVGANILTVFTSDAATYFGPSNLASVVATQIGYLNTSFTNSLVNDVVVVSVGYMTVPAANGYTAGPCSARAQAMVDYNVNKTRDNSNADVVVVISVGSTGEEVGLAGCSDPVIGATASTAFVGAEAIAVDPANWTSLNYMWTIAHEFGHMMGLRHQTANGYAYNDPTLTPHHDGHGWIVVTSDYCIHTIMAMEVIATFPPPAIPNPYSCPPGKPQYHAPHWSNAAQWGYDGQSNLYYWGSLAYNANEVAYIHDAVATMSGFHNTKFAPNLGAAILMFLYIDLF